MGRTAPLGSLAAGVDRAAGLGRAVRREQLSGRHPYRTLYLVGFAFWMGALHWLRLPIGRLAWGWVALSAYLGVYLPLLVGLSRVAVHRLRVPVILAVPTVYAGLELARAHVLTGFTMASLAHTQIHWLALIQCSDLCGEYGVDFVMMFVAACFGRMLGPRPTWWPLLPAVGLLAATLAYGSVRMAGSDAVGQASSLSSVGRTSSLSVALIQGSVDTEMKEDASRCEEVFAHYYRLTSDAVKQAGGGAGRLDVLIWPETMFRLPLWSVDENARLPEGWHGTREEFRQRIEEGGRRCREDLGVLPRRFHMPMIFGIEVQHFGADRLHSFNSALLVGDDGKIQARYDKMHPVMFGEYVPFARYAPWIYRLLPMGILDDGPGPAALSFPAACGWHRAFVMRPCCRT